MDIRFTGSERYPLVEINNARITFKNFEGRGDTFNAKGKRNFAVIIPNAELADQLINDVNADGASWNVKVRPAREEDEDDFRYLKVNVAFNDRGPGIFLETNGKLNKLTEETVGLLDHIAISEVSLTIRPYDNITNGKAYRTAYLQSIRVTQAPLDRFEEEYENYRSRVAEEEEEY